MGVQYCHQGGMGGALFAVAVVQLVKAAGDHFDEVKGLSADAAKLVAGTAVLSLEAAVLFAEAEMLFVGAPVGLEAVYLWPGL